MAGLAELLAWQWRAYWRRILRGGTAARSNLVVLGLIALAGLARYITFLRDVSGPTLEFLIAALLVLCIQPGWDASGLALSPRDLARFPLQPFTRAAIRMLSRFIPPLSWMFCAVCIGGFWPVSKMTHGALAVLTLFLLMSACFDAGIVLADFAGTGLGARITRVGWSVLALATVGAWFAGVRTVPPLPSKLVLLAGAGNWTAPAAALLCALVAYLATLRSLPWALRHAPREERSGQARSASTITLFQRELRLHSSLAEVRTAWVICGALCFYLVTADHPEPDALRVMLAVVAFLAIAGAMNHFAPDGLGGLDRFLLWPVNGARIVGSKNAAFAAAIAGPTAPLAILAAWRFGWREGTADFLEAAAIVLAILAWGNVTSVRHPENRETASGGNILDQLVGMATIAVPTAGAIGALRGAGNAAPIYVLLMAALCAVAYIASLQWSAGYFARYHEQMRRALT